MFPFNGLEKNELVAYTRIIPQGISYTEASIGRVVTSPDHRAAGLGRELMKLSIDQTFRQFNCTDIRIGAQLYLKHFYESLGFIQSREEFLEDGIPHIEMLLSK
jgi:ElaA protein